MANWKNLHAGLRIQPWTLVKLINSSGGNGVVWEAVANGKDAVAVKFLKGVKEDARARFLDEIRALQQLSDVPGVLPLLAHDSEPQGDIPPWFMMPLAEPLLEVVRSLDFDIKINALAAYARTLARIHERGYAHRDIKPGNLFRLSGAWMLGDLGLVDYPEKDAVTAKGQQLGPRFYLAPEMLNVVPDQDFRPADVYSLGKTAWVVLTGQNWPFPGRHEPAVAYCSLGTYVDYARLEVLDWLLYHMTAMDPGKRISTAAAAQQLEEFSKMPSGPPPPGHTLHLRERLRATLSKFEAARNDEQAQQTAARVAFRTLRGAVRQLADRATRELSLPFSQSSDPPSWLKHHQAFQEPPGLLHECEARYVREGGATEVQLEIGADSHLDGSGRVHLSVGYLLTEWIGGRNATPMGTFGTCHRGGGMIGTVELERSAVELAGKLNADYSGALVAFADRLERASGTR